jgi:hypothetical protein
MRIRSLMMAGILAAALVAGTSTAASASPTVDSTTAVMTVSAHASRNASCVKTVLYNYVRIRTGPHLTSPTVAQVNAGTKLTSPTCQLVLGDNTNCGGSSMSYYWWPVTYAGVTRYVHQTCVS